MTIQQTTPTCLYCENTELIAVTNVTHLYERVGLCDKHQREKTVPEYHCKFCNCIVYSDTNFSPVSKGRHREDCPRAYMNRDINYLEWLDDPDQDLEDLMNHAVWDRANNG